MKDLLLNYQFHSALSFIKFHFFISLFASAFVTVGADGSAKLCNWTNGNAGNHLKNGIDHVSTLSRPLSMDAISNGTLPHNGRRTPNGMITHSANGLHEDSDFPTSLKSLSRRKPIVWMRPHVIQNVFV